MERNPSNFFRDFDKAVEGRKSRANASYQRKILKKYFPQLVSGVPGFENSPDPLNLVKDNIPTMEAEQLFIENIKLDLIELLEMPRTEVWSEFTKRMDEGRENTALVFPVTGAGDWVIHNMAEVPEGLVNTVQIMITTEKLGNAYSLPIKNYIKERVN